MKPAPDAHGRPLVTDLLLQHERQILELRSLVCSSEYYEPSRNDDLWLVRFLLSHSSKGGVASAAQSALATLAWRHEHRMDDDTEPCGGPEGLRVPAVAKLYGDCLRDEAAISYYVPDQDRGPLLVAVPALIDFHKAAATMTEEETSLTSRLSNEWLWRKCDEVAIPPDTPATSRYS